MEVAITTKLLICINYILLIYCSIELLNEDTISLIRKQTAEMEQSKVLFLLVTTMVIAGMHIWLIYQKILIADEKKKEIQLKNKIAEHEYNNRKNSEDIIQ